MQKKRNAFVEIAQRRVGTKNANTLETVHQYHHCTVHIFALFRHHMIKNMECNLSSNYTHVSKQRCHFWTNKRAAENEFGLRSPAFHDVIQKQPIVSDASIKLSNLGVWACQAGFRILITFWLRPPQPQPPGTFISHFSMSKLNPNCCWQLVKYFEFRRPWCLEQQGAIMAAFRWNPKSKFSTSAKPLSLLSRYVQLFTFSLSIFNSGRVWRVLLPFGIQPLDSSGSDSWHCSGHLFPQVLRSHLRAYFHVQPNHLFIFSPFFSLFSYSRQNRLVIVVETFGGRNLQNPWDIMNMLGEMVMNVYD